MHLKSSPRKTSGVFSAAVGLLLAGLNLTLFPVMASPVDSYKVQFPERSIGRLFIVDKKWNKEAWPAQMKQFADACGTVQVPHGAMLGLRPNASLNEHADLLNGEFGKAMTILLANEMEVGDKLLEGISRCTSLERLELNDSDLDDARLKYLKPLKHLGSLSIKKNAITGPGLANLSDLKDLWYIDINDNMLKNGSLKPLLGLPKFKHLEASRCNLNNDDLKDLAQLKKMEILYLAYNRDITDKGILYLSCLNNLRTLSLEDTRITPQGLLPLKLPALKTLIVPSYFPLSKNASMVARVFPQATISVPDKMRNHKMEFFK